MLSPTTCPGPNLAAPFTAGGTIRLRGKNLTENEHVKLGAYHTLELEQQRAFTLFKSSWDALDIDRVKQATDPALSADLAAVLITVRGLRDCWEPISRFYIQCIPRVPPPCLAPPLTWYSPLLLWSPWAEELLHTHSTCRRG